MGETSLLYYLDKHLQGTITAEERIALINLLRDSSNDEALFQLMGASWEEWKTNTLHFPEVANRVKAAIFEKDEYVMHNVLGARPTHLVYFLRKWGWAAAILIFLGAGAYLYITTKKTTSPVAINQRVPQGILPGSNRAILTLSDGSTITLDGASIGAIAQQGSSSITKKANGEISYDVNGISQSEVMMNTMTTPRGGQYQLVLPDGSKVWLNAASSVSYPAAFAGNERKINIKGEAYVEVAKNKAKPFLVDVDGKSSIQVLGTRFNINSYADDGCIRITLTDGSVKVINLTNRSVTNQSNKIRSPVVVPSGRQTNVNSLVLRPGDQAVQSANAGLQLNDRPRLEQVLAWKNGWFDFTGASFLSVMKDVERWYDIEVKYDGKIPDFKLKGKMDRGVSLSDWMRFMEDYDLNVTLAGRTLIVKGK